MKNGNFADPDKESLTEKGAGVTSDLSKEPCPCHVRSHLNYRFNISIALFLVNELQGKFFCLFVCFCLCGFQRMDMVYFAELRSAVDKNLERFLKSCVFYFIRNTKGEMLILLQ